MYELFQLFKQDVLAFLYFRQRGLIVNKKQGGLKSKVTHSFLRIECLKSTSNRYSNETEFQEADVDFRAYRV